MKGIKTMIEQHFESVKRQTKHIKHAADFVVAGGGMAGVCAAIAAARAGLKVVLVQDRPVLGGNASSEVRLWILGATSHMGNNNRWAREGGILNEILMENTYRNKEGNPIIFDTVLLDKVLAEKNISLFLNTVIYDIEKGGEKRIDSIKAYNPQCETSYEFTAPLFCDSTGDGLIAYLGGATYRMGAEDAAEYDEKFAPDKLQYGEKLGHTIFFYHKDAGHPVSYVAPSFALKPDEVERYINRIHQPDYFNALQTGCKYWWIEYGGRIDTITDTEEIKYKLWSVVHGIWNYIKNSGKFPEAANLTLEWVGNIPGKRESRRFVGRYMLNQKDVVEQRPHPDTVAHGGWSLDLHPADGVFSTNDKACNQWHSKGVYPIPYRCYLTPDLENVFLAGRIISATHVAFASTRVMATCGTGGEAVGTAAAMCIKNRCMPSELLEADKMKLLQQTLTYNGMYLPQTDSVTPDALLHDAHMTASSVFQVGEIPFNGEWLPLRKSAAQMLPLQKGVVPIVKVRVKASRATDLQVELKASAKSFNHTPDVVLGHLALPLRGGEQEVELQFNTEMPHTGYAFLCFMSSEHVEIQTSRMLLSGFTAVFNKKLAAVSNGGKQEPTEDIGVDSFEFWCPERAPHACNIAMQISPALDCFPISNLKNTHYRPIDRPNAWVACPDDEAPVLTLTWQKAKELKGITLFTDPDYDHPMESVQWGHHDNKMPYCVDGMEIIVDGKVVHTVTDNYQAIVQIDFAEKIVAFQLQIRLINSTPDVPVALMGLQVH